MRITTSLLVGTSLVALAVPAHAQTEQAAIAQEANDTDNTTTPPADEVSSFEEDAIIVTATKRASRVQDVPFSINAQTQEDIQRANAQTLEDISRNVASLTVQNLGPGQSQVSVRGVSAGQIVRDQPGVKEQVGVYLDEFVASLSLFTPDFDLFDLNRLETLRGPQGTLFGSGSVGGTLRYITNQPTTDRVEGAVEGNVNMLKGGGVGYSVKGAYNIPFGQGAALRVVGYNTHFGGFIDSIGPYSKKNVNDGDRWGTRIALLLQPSDNFRITPRVVYQKVTAGGFNRQDEYILFDNQFTTGGNTLGEREQYLRFREKFSDKTLLTDLVMSYDFGGAELTSVSSYLNRNILVSRDASALTGSVYISFAGAAPDAAGGAALNSNLRDTTKLKQWTQELRLSSTGAGPFQWVFGGFYSKVDRTYAQRLPTPGSDPFGQAFLDVAAGGLPISATYNGFPANSPYNADIPYDIKQTALFGEGSYQFGQFKLTAGARYYNFKELRDFVSGGIFSDGNTNLGDKTKSNGVSPRVILTYEANRALSFNVQAAKGFRLGGVNDPLNLPLCTPADAEIFGGYQQYDDETLWNYEAGMKYGLGRSMYFNAAAFHNAIKDLQVTLDAGSCSSRVVFNVPKAHSTGLEAEFGVRPTPDLNLSVATTVQSAKFDSTVTTGTGAVLGGIRDGNRLPTVPKFQFAATATYERPLNDSTDWNLTASFQHLGSRYTQPSDQETGAGLVSSALFYDPATGAYGSGVNDFGSLKLPSYSLVNLSGGLHWDNGLEVIAYVNNIFDKNPLLSLDRERGLRARIAYNIGQPRTIGLTVRKMFGRSLAAPAPAPVMMPPPPPAPVQEMAPPPPPPPPPPPVERGERGE